MALRFLKVLGGEGANREVCTQAVEVRGGRIYDAVHDFPYDIVESEFEQLMGWGPELNGDMYQLVSEHNTLETSARELMRIGVL